MYHDCEEEAVGSTDVDLEQSNSTKERGSEIVRPLGRGWNCSVLVQIWDTTYRVLLDTGASRNLIQTKFLKSLAALPESKCFLRGPGPTDRIIGIAGIHSDQHISEENSVSQACEIQMTFMTGSKQHPRPSGKVVEVQFGLMGSCADELVIGGPQLAYWGFCLYSDDQRPRVNLLRLQVEALVDKYYSNPHLVQPSLVMDREEFEKFKRNPTETPNPKDRRIRSRQMYDDKDIDDY